MHQNDVVKCIALTYSQMTPPSVRLRPHYSTASCSHSNGTVSMERVDSPEATLPIKPPRMVCGNEDTSRCCAFSLPSRMK